MPSRGGSPAGIDRICKIIVNFTTRIGVGGSREIVPARCDTTQAQLNTTARLREIKIPVPAIAGADDPSAAGTKWSAESVPEAIFVSIARAAHISNIEQPGAFNAAVREFLCT